MEVIVLGLYNSLDKNKFDDNLLNLCNLDIVWDYAKYVIVSQEGIQLLEKIFNIKETGIIVEKNWTDAFTSYPLIYEISEYILEGKVYPRLFQLFDKIKELKIEKIIMAFADYWDEKTLIRLKNVNISTAKDDLSNIYTWCETYIDLKNNVAIRNSDYPLIFEINCKED